MLDAVSALEFPFPQGRFAGRGIVICGGGERYLPSAYVLVRVLRHLKCSLPVEIWHLGEAEMPGTMRGLFAELGAVCVDGSQVRRMHPVRRLAGWELKCFAIMHSAFEEVMLLDADNCPVRDPAFLFDELPYQQTGAIFWPDYTRLGPERAVWAASGIAYRDEPEFESGQIVVNKRRCWKALNVAMHINEYSDWWYRLVHGDKETFHLAWRKIGQDYAMPSRGVEPLEATMLQFDFAGERLFQHRNFAKSEKGEFESGKQKSSNGDGSSEGVKESVSCDEREIDKSTSGKSKNALYEAARAQNKCIAGFRFEKECVQFIAEPRERWIAPLRPAKHRTRPKLCRNAK